MKDITIGQSICEQAASLFAGRLRSSLMADEKALVGMLEKGGYLKPRDSGNPGRFVGQTTAE